MKSGQAIAASIDEYIAVFPPPVRAKLKVLRATVVKAAPLAEEGISYKMPIFKQQGFIVYFAAHASHIGLYPGPSPIRHFARELARYVTAKGTVRFPLDEPIPVGLVTKLVKFKVRENLEKAALKKAKKTIAKKRVAKRKS